MKCVGWLSPSGELISCEGHAHLDMARQITKDLGVFDAQKHSDEILQKLGWVRISRYIYNDPGLVFLNPYRSVLSMHQKEFLQHICDDMFEEISKGGKKQLNSWGITENGWGY